MKKLFALLLTLVMLVGVFAACGGGDSIIGTWEGEQDGVTLELTFEEGGKGKMGSMGTTLDCTWEIKDGKLSMSMEMFGQSGELFKDAEYSVKGDELSITADGETVVLKKK